MKSQCTYTATYYRPCWLIRRAISCWWFYRSSPKLNRPYWAQHVSAPTTEAWEWITFGWRNVYNRFDRSSCLEMTILDFARGLWELKLCLVIVMKSLENQRNKWYSLSNRSVSKLETRHCIHDLKLVTSDKRKVYAVIIFSQGLRDKHSNVIFAWMESTSPLGDVRSHSTWLMKKVDFLIVNRGEVLSDVSWIVQWKPFRHAAVSAVVLQLFVRLNICSNSIAFPKVTAERLFDAGDMQPFLPDSFNNTFPFHAIWALYKVIALCGLAVI
jgi:hypothetical protein